MPLGVGTAIGLGMGVLGGLGRALGIGGMSKGTIRRLMAQNPQYQENPLARQQLGLAQSMLNARMPGASAAERNIFANQANTLSNVQRAATDSSQALALAAGTQGQTNQAFQNLGMEEAQDYQRRYGNLAGATQGVISEGDKVYQDKVRRYQDLAALTGANIQQNMNNWGTLSNLGFGLANFGLAGGFKGGGGSGGGGSKGGWGQGVAISF